MNIGAIFTVLFTQPITNILVLCYQLFMFLHVPFALGFSIIALTTIIRLVLLPFTTSQIRASKKMQDLAPHLSLLKEKHKGDKKKHQEEMMKLYKNHGVNPASGCLPVILQIPIIWSLYHVLTQVVNVNSLAKIKEVNNSLYFDSLKIRGLWDTSFFGLPLSLSPSKEISHMPLLILIPAVTVLLQLVLSKMMMPEKPIVAKKDDFQAAFMQQSLYLFPLMVGFFSFSLPLGLSLYWNTFTIFGILQQYFLVGPGGLVQWTEKLKKYGKRN